MYSGSYDGFVYVWNLDATLAAKIDVNAATRDATVRPRADRRHRMHYRDAHGATSMVRDVGWHPNAPMLVGKWSGPVEISGGGRGKKQTDMRGIIASAWTGPHHDGGTASLHSFNEAGSDEGEPTMGIPVDEKLEPYWEARDSRW